MQNTVGDEVKLKTANGQEIDINANNIYQPRENLGHYKSTAGTYQTQTDKILKKAVEINNAIAKYGASYNGARMFYNSA